MITPPDAATPRWVNLAGWGWLAAVAIFLVFYLLPRKGVDFGDEGWVLASALGAARGWHRDLVLPQAPTWVVNAPLMLAGVESYLGLRLAFYTLISACLAVAVRAVRWPQPLSGVDAILITLAGLTTLSSLISYNNTPHYLIVASLGLTLIAVNTGSRPQAIVAGTLAALTATVAGLLNFTMFPAAFISLAGLWVVTRTRTTVTAVIALALVLSSAGIVWYVAQIGTAAFVTVPGAHGLDPSRVLAGLLVVAEWLVPALALRLLASWWWRHAAPPVRDRRLALLAATLALGVAVVLLLIMLTTAGVCDCGGSVLQAVSARASVLGLADLSRLQFPGMIVATWAVAVVAIAVAFAAPLGDPPTRTLLLIASLYISYLFQELFSAMDPLYLFVYYAGPLLALGFFLLFDRPQRISRAVTAVALAATLVGSIVYSIHFTQPGFSSVTGDKVPAPTPKLAGLLESPERAETLSRLVSAFDQHRCRGRTLVALNTVPLVYYLLEVEPPKGLEYIFMPYFFDAALTRATLEQSRAWCALVSWNGLMRPSADQIRAEADGVIDYLKRHAVHTISLSPRTTPVHHYDDFTLFVGPATE